MIIFSLNIIGKPMFFPYGITNGTSIVPCKSEIQAENLLKNSRYEGYAIIDSDEPSAELLRALEGISFDRFESANNFINNGGYEESVTSRVEDLECMVAEMIGGVEQ